MTAEFVVAMPAVLLVLAAGLFGLGLVAAQVRLQDAAGIAARALARGEAEESVALGALTGSDVERAVSRDGELVCVRLEQRLAVVVLAARSCALS